MNKLARFIPVAFCVLALSGAQAFAQSPAGRSQPGASSQTQEPQQQQPGAGGTDAVAGEIALLRRSLQGLNTRLREISERLLAPGLQTGAGPNPIHGSISQNIELLSRTEQRAELLRRQLLDLIEKETSYRNRLAQLDEEMRPDSIDRSVALVGTTRAMDLRDTRRRILENERRGVENLLHQAAPSRARLEDDVRQADAMVLKLRQRLLPLIEKEIDKINPY